jgi:hypothetical protein
MKKNVSESNLDSKKQQRSQLKNNDVCKTAKFNKKVQDDSTELLLDLEPRTPLVERVKKTLAEVEAEWAEELKEYRRSAKGKEDFWENYTLMSEAQRKKVDEAFDELGEILDEYDKWSKDLDDWLAENDPDYDLDEDWEIEQQLEEERQREEWDKELEENGMFAEEE